MKKTFFRLTLTGVASVLGCVNLHAASVAPVAAEHGMVVTAQHLATQVGVDVLKKGGNAIDAAVAVGYALAVVYPAAGNLGGGGFMLVRMKTGEAHFLDYRERAPAVATAAAGAVGNPSGLPPSQGGNWPVALFKKYCWPTV